MAQKINQTQSQGTTLGFGTSSSTNQTGITTETTVSGVTTIITIPPGGRRIKITATAQVYTSINGDVGELKIKQDGVNMKTSRHLLTSTTSTQMISVASFVPTAGSHTYLFTVARNSGTGTLLIENVVNPAEMLVEII